MMIYESTAAKGVSATEDTQTCAAPRRIFTHHYATPLGGMTMASDGAVLIGLWFDGQKYFARIPGLAAAAQYEWTEASLPIFAETERWLDVYFGGREPDFTPAFSVGGTPLRRAVWEILLGIPYGQTASYGAIARRVAERMGIPAMSARAVGGAVGHNPLSLIIPCHRAVGADGSLTGYAGGIGRKEMLLRLEGAEIRDASGKNGGKRSGSACKRTNSML